MKPDPICRQAAISIFRFLPAVAICALAASCVAVPPNRPAPTQPDPFEEEVNLSWEYCDSRWRSGDFKTRAERARCISDGEMPIYRKYRYPHLDLIVLLHQKRMELARREDAGEPVARVATDWEKAVKAVAGEEARRVDLLMKDLDKPVTTQQAWLRKQDPSYRPWAVAHTRCVWVGERLSCMVDSRAVTSKE